MLQQHCFSTPFQPSTCRWTTTWSESCSATVSCSTTPILCNSKRWAFRGLVWGACKCAWRLVLPDVCAGTQVRRLGSCSVCVGPSHPNTSATHACPQAFVTTTHLAIAMEYVRWDRGPSWRRTPNQQRRAHPSRRRCRASLCCWQRNPAAQPSAAPPSCVQVLPHLTSSLFLSSAPAAVICFIM